MGEERRRERKGKKEWKVRTARGGMWEQRGLKQGRRKGKDEKKKQRKNYKEREQSNEKRRNHSLVKEKQNWTQKKMGETKGNRSE